MPGRRGMCGRVPVAAVRSAEGLGVGQGARVQPAELRAQPPPVGGGADQEHVPVLAVPAEREHPGHRQRSGEPAGAGLPPTYGWGPQLAEPTDDVVLASWRNTWVSI